MPNRPSDLTQMSAAALAEKLTTNQTTGLTTAQLHAARVQYGENALAAAPKIPLWRRIIGHLQDITSLILIFAVAVSTYLALTTDSDWTKVFILAAIIVLNVGISLFQEGRAEKAIASLQAMSDHTVTVIREGQTQPISTTDLVPGDLIQLVPGDIVPADARLIGAGELVVNESILTGESAAVVKSATSEPVERLEEAGNIVFSGTAITQGRMQALVIATGMQTALGKIAGMINRTQRGQTLLDQRLNVLVKRLSLFAVAGGVVTILLSTLLHNETLVDSLMVGVSLAIAAVPETLPVIVTLALTYGVQQMAKRHAIIRRVTAVETIGNVTVIASDKTGTLTQNQMTVVRYWDGHEAPQAVGQDAPLTEEALANVRQVLLATNATLATDGQAAVGDSTEQALVRLAADHEVTRDAVAQDAPRLAEDPFDSHKKTMATLHRNASGQYFAIVKGAVDRLHFRDVTPRALQRMNDDFAQEGLRVLAAGVHHFKEKPGADWATALADLDFLGLFGIMDPARPEVPAAIQEAQRAGIRPVMITGDHPATATAIATQIGILHPGDKVMTGGELAQLDDDAFAEVIDDIRVFARTTPADKLRIVKTWQTRGEVVAMTGDGVNDAPALRQADVGVAMGITGTEVAKQAADMILTDDNFATIISAVRQGRVVYQNILKAVEFLVSVNFAQILTMVAAVLLGWGAIMSPEQLLIVNIIADGIPGLFLSREPGERGIMAFPPLARDASIWAYGLGQRVAVRAGTYMSLILGTYALGRFALSANVPAVGMTMLFFLLTIGSMLDVYPIKERQPLTLASLTANPWLTRTIMILIAVLVTIGLTPALANVFGLVALTVPQWLIVGALVWVPAVIVETFKRWQLKKTAGPAWQMDESEIG
ncbi:cation-translocating P-type ATPase [Lacticaseibacillus yichunensis]|uniref:Cation-translocating P-type ATPase n=1 Tax=Lacticaseibacillus yichunensis TaxID=2486015 RepID=A0ABW4CKI0_9LACO|nr:cation-translocating P-type ATPase [Lacticaseibacillus yichunensis]